MKSRNDHSNQKCFWCPCGHVRIVLRSIEKNVKLLKARDLPPADTSRSPTLCPLILQLNPFYLNSQSQQSLPYSNAVKQTAVIKKIEISWLFLFSLMTRVTFRLFVGRQWPVIHKKSDFMELLWILDAAVFTEAADNCRLLPEKCSSDKTGTQRTQSLCDCTV